MAPLGTENESSEMSNRSSNALDTASTSSTCPQVEGLAEYRFLGFRFGFGTLANSTHQSARRARFLAWRAFGWVRTHSSSALMLSDELPLVVARLEGASLSLRAKSNSCLRTECRVLGQVRGSSQQHYPESSDRV